MADVLAQGDGDTRVHDEGDEPWSRRRIFGTSLQDATRQSWSAL